MTVPNKALVLNLGDIEELTLVDNRLLYGERYSIDAFFQFLLDHVDHETSWTVDEISAIQRKELADIHAQVRAKLAEQAVPLAK